MTKIPIFCPNHLELNPNSEEMRIFLEEEKGVRTDPMLMVIEMP
jgi:hypothetical protein